jgi:hypothetical protein
MKFFLHENKQATICKIYTAQIIFVKDADFFIKKIINNLIFFYNNVSLTKFKIIN